MDFAFYNEARRRTALGVVPEAARRVLRRIQRPMFFRLRDLLHFLYARQEEDRVRAEAAARELAALAARVGELAREVAALRDQLAEAGRRAAEFERRVLVDLSVLDGRIAGTEDDLLRVLAGEVV